MRYLKDLTRDELFNNRLLQYKRLTDKVALFIKDVNSSNWVYFKDSQYYKLAKTKEYQKYKTNFTDDSGLLLLQYIKNSNLEYELLYSDEVVE